MDLYTFSVPQFIKMLKSLDMWLGLGAELAERKKFDPDVLLSLRLAPDQYALVRQVQSACDTAKLTTARLIDKDAPSHPDGETTLAQLRERIASVIGWLETVRPADFEGVAARRLSPAWLQGKSVAATDYLVQYGVANFYFHIVSAYSILRHAGTDLGKRIYIGGLPLQD
jgi:hypothetical protein